MYLRHNGSLMASCWGQVRKGDLYSARGNYRSTSDDATSFRLLKDMSSPDLLLQTLPTLGSWLKWATGLRDAVMLHIQHSSFTVSTESLTVFNIETLGVTVLSRMRSDTSTSHTVQPATDREAARGKTGVQTRETGFQIFHDSSITKCIHRKKRSIWTPVTRTTRPRLTAAASQIWRADL